MKKKYCIIHIQSIYYKLILQNSWSGLWKDCFYLIRVDGVASFSSKDGAERNGDRVADDREKNCVQPDCRPQWKRRHNWCRKPVRTTFKKKVKGRRERVRIDEECPEIAADQHWALLIMWTFCNMTIFWYLVSLECSSTSVRVWNGYVMGQMEDK